MENDRAFAPYRPLKFTVRGSFCGTDECRISPELAALQFEVKEVYGTSARVANGERYVVRGEYTLRGDDPHALSLATPFKAFGATAFVMPGNGKCEVSTEILQLVENPVNGLGILVVNERTGKCEIVLWVMLKE